MGFSKAYLEDKMANGINDILSVYRQSLASERQNRMAEMQLALSALQFEAQQKFRESGRRREDALGSLEYASASTKEALSQDSNLIYSKIASIKPIAEADYDDTTGAMKKSNKIVGKLEQELQEIMTHGRERDLQKIQKDTNLRAHFLQLWKNLESCIKGVMLYKEIYP